MSETTVKKPRPKYLDIWTLAFQLPVPGFASILHRVSGAGLFLMLPLLLWLFGASLESPGTAAAASACIANPLVKLVLFGLLWAYLHHFCMGIRFLLLDVHVGLEKQTARASAWAVLAVSLVLTVLIGAKLFLAGGL